MCSPSPCIVALVEARPNEFAAGRQEDAVSFWQAALDFVGQEIRYGSCTHTQLTAGCDQDSFGVSENCSKLALFPVGGEPDGPRSYSDCGREATSTRILQT